MVSTKQEFIERMQRDIDRWRVDATKAAPLFPGLAQEIGQWIAEGERLLGDLRSHA
jgi:hypothetical protein